MAPQQRDKSGLKGACTTVLSRSAAQARARLCVSMFSSASFVLFFYVFSPVFKIIFMACCVFSWSSSNENLLSWSHSICVLISSSLLADFVFTHVFSSSFLLVFFVFSFSCA